MLHFEVVEGAGARERVRVCRSMADDRCECGLEERKCNPQDCLERWCQLDFQFFM